MKICVLGSTGMLGSAVGKYFIEKYGENNVILSYRNKDVSYGKNKFKFDALKYDTDKKLNNALLSNVKGCDYLVNCIGVIKPFIEQDKPGAIYLNGIFPYRLAEFCKNNKIKMFHITTDCAYSGYAGEYTEESDKDCLDFYGKSKVLGEEADCMTIRTSIIGEEIHKNASLIEWAKSQKGKTVNGFKNHFWNGITTKQYADVCYQIIEKSLYETGLFHVFSNVVSKYDMLRYFDEKFELGLTINGIDADLQVDRTLSTVKELQDKLHIPSVKAQIFDL